MRGLNIVTAAAAVALAGCSEDAAAPDAAEAAETKAAPAPGEYEASWTVTEIRSTDKTDPATKLEVGSTGTVKACVTEGPSIDLAMFAEGKDECRPSTSYVRSGRINVQMQCRREGEGGPVMQTMTGTSTAESFEGEISTSTYLTGFGDYSMIRKVTARRLGDCPAKEDSETA